MIFLTITPLLYLLNFVSSQTCMDNNENKLKYKEVTPGELSWGVRIKEKFLEFHPVNLWTCAEQCMRRKGCLSFNFCEKSDFCELNHVEKERGTPDTGKGNNLFVQSDIKSWQKNIHIVGNCSARPCAEKYMCNASGLCELSDCGKHPDVNINHAVVKMYGDHKICNGALFGCEEPFTVKDQNGERMFDEMIPVKCDMDGHWQIPSFICDVASWRRFDNHWYYFSLKKMNWNDAKNFCRERSSHLVTIEDEREFKWTQSQIKDWAWSGGNDIEDEGRWVWEEDNSEVTLEWHPGEPNIAAEDCLLLGPKFKGAANHVCRLRLVFICEY